MTKSFRRLLAWALLVFPLTVFIELQIPSNPAVAQSAASPSVSAAVPTASPEEVGLSSERLERITATIQRSVDEGRIAGGVALVARHGKIAYLKAVGMADREAKKPLRTDSIFRIC